VRDIREAFNKQEKEVIENLLKRQNSYGILKAAIATIQKQGRPFSELFDFDFALNFFLIIADNISGEALASGIEQEMDATNLDSFNVSEERVQGYLDFTSARFAQKVNTSTGRQLRRTIRQGVDKGETISEIINRVHSVYGQARSFRAERMARTEVGSAINFGKLEAIRSSKVVTEKEWVTVLDGREREEHAQVDGQIVPRNKAFRVGGERLMYPRDPHGSPENIINCRCTIIGKRLSPLDI